MKIKHIMKILVSIFLYSSLFLIWIVSIAGLLGFAHLFADLKQLNNEMLMKIFVLIYFCAFIVQVMIFKRRKSYVKKPLKMLTCTFVAIFINTIVFNAGWIYISEYSREKWENNKELRHYMVYDFEQEYQIMERSEQEVIDLLGNPVYVEDRSTEERNIKVLSYYAGRGLIDIYTYDIIFENGIVTETEVNEH